MTKAKCSRIQMPDFADADKFAIEQFQATGVKGPYYKHCYTLLNGDQYVTYWAPSASVEPITTGGVEWELVKELDL